MTSEELEIIIISISIIIIYKTENNLPHTYTHTHLVCCTGPEHELHNNIAWADLIQGWIQQKQLLET